MKYVTIESQGKKYENVIDFSYRNLRPDFVRCNKCMSYMLVDADETICPICQLDGYLMDIEQNIDY